MIADLDTLLTALYVELTDRIIPFHGLGAAGRAGRRKSPTPSWPAWPWRRSCCASMTSGTGCAPPRLVGAVRGCWQGEYNLRLRQLAADGGRLRWLAARRGERSCCA